MKTKYTLHQIGLFSLFKLGLVIGLVLNILPALLITVSGLEVVRFIDLIMQKMVFTVGGPGSLGIEIDLIKQMNLQNYAAFFRAAASVGILQMILVILGILILASLYSGVAMMLGGLIFNLLVNISGGLEITLSEAAVRPGTGLTSPNFVSTANPPAQFVPAQVQPVRTAAGGPRLEITQPYRQTFPLVFPVSTVGSGPGSNVHLNGLPAMHFQIAREGEQVILRDLCQGQMPLQIQGHLVQSRNLLKDGFVIQTGGYTITYRDS